MTHQFNTELAQMYGIEEAILIENLNFWILKNKANKVHEHNGTYWTYNSAKAFQKLFPYMTARKINYTLNKLVDKGIIQTGNFNQSPYDRTLWYAFTENGESILRKCKMVDTEESDENSNNNNNNNNIADNNTDNNLDREDAQGNSIKNEEKPVRDTRKHKYGEYKNVRLSDEDLEKLKSEFPSDWKQRIERLSEYMEMYGKKYKNHLAVMRNWAKNDKQKKEPDRERPKTIDVSTYDPYAKDPLAEKWKNGTITLEDLKAYDK